MRVLTLKFWVSLILAISFYVSGRLMFSSFSSPISWPFTLALFIYGYRWVYLFLMKKTMPASLAGETMEYNDPKMKIPRLGHFIFGSGVCIGVSII